MGGHGRGESVRRRSDVLRQRCLPVDRRRRDLEARGACATAARSARSSSTRRTRRVFVAAAGNLSGTAGQRGVYRRGNGKNWKHVLPTPNNTTGGVDLAIDPANPKRVYATLWDHHRNNGARVYGGVGSGLFRSDNGGDTWHRLQNVIGRRATDESGTGLHSDASLGRIGVAVAPERPDRVYVVSGTQYGLDKGFYVSNDGGTTFRPGGHAGGNSGYQWWFGRSGSTRTTQNHLFNADVNLRESTDGGATGTSPAACTPTSTPCVGPERRRPRVPRQRRRRLPLRGNGADAPGCTRRTSR